MRFSFWERLRVIASMSRERSKLFPDVPSIFEALQLTKEQQDWIDFRDDMRTQGIESTVLRIEETIRRDVPEARYIFIEAGSFRPRRVESADPAVSAD